MLQADGSAVLLDVRSTMEYLYVGHPVDAVHIPLKEPPGWEVEPAFARKVREELSRRTGVDAAEDVPVLALCRSGQRSRQAAEILEAAGFKHLYNVIEGFEGERDGDNRRGTINGWRFHGLPWEQS